MAEVDQDSWSRKWRCMQNGRGRLLRNQLLIGLLSALALDWTGVLVPVLATEDGSSLWAMYQYFSETFPGSETWVDTAGDSDVNPCDGWAHVQCDNELRITVLDLSNLNINGILHKFVGSLTALRELNLHGNNFTGPLPLTLGQLRQLRKLDLGNNGFSGTIPPQLRRLTALKDLNLANNSLTGSIPGALQNKFCYTFFENNPASAGLDPSTFPNCIQEGYVTSPPPPAPAASSRSSLGVGFILGIALGGIALLVIGAIVIFVMILRRRPPPDERPILTEEDLMEIEAGLDKSNLAHIHRFSVDDLKSATNNWETEIGSGASSVVYKGSIPSANGGPPKEIAVKRLKSEQLSKEAVVAFCNEMDVISRAVHRHVMKLEGFCIAEGERILVFPFLRLGSVEDHLRGHRLHDKRPLSLAARKNIAIGAARGLLYLHEECSVRIIHRDIKAANVLLTNNLEPVVTDFGLAKLVDEEEKPAATKVAGTFGHIAPEYLTSGRLSDKVDVYAFGIFLLELISGKNAAALGRLPEEGEDLRTWLLRLLEEGRLMEVIDIELRAKYLEIEDGVYKLDEIVTMVQVATFCMIPDPDRRPSMSECLRLLQGEGFAEARQKIQEEVPDSVLNWNPGYGQFNSLSESMMSFMTDESFSNIMGTDEDRLR